MTTVSLMSAEELLRMPHHGRRYELIAGELRTMSPAGWRHGNVGARLHGLLAGFVAGRPLGMLFMAETGFLLARDPDTVRAPDIAFIRNDHVPADLPEEAFWPGPPDLAVEVVSPSETYREVDEKAKEWLAAGTTLVWVVNPLARTLSVYRADADVVTLTERDELSGDGVLPGFSCRIAEIFVG